MYKIIALLMAAVTIVFSMAACGGGKPDDLSQESYDLVEDMIASGNMYLDGTINASMAADFVYMDIQKLDKIEEPVSPSTTRVQLIFQTKALYDGLKAGNRDSVKGNIESLEKTIGK